MATRRSNESQPVADLLAFGSIIVAVGCSYLHYPGVVAAWALLWAASLIEPYPPLTGTRVGGRAQPADYSEVMQIEHYRVWQARRLTLLNPLAWLPGKGVLGSWLLALALAYTSFWLPTTIVGRLGNAVAGFVIVAGLTAGSRQVTGYTGTRLSALSGASPARKAALVGAFLAGAAAGWFALVALSPTLRPYVGANIVGLASGLAAMAGFGAAGAVLRPLCSAEFKALQEAKADWWPRWKAMKVDPMPSVVSVVTTGAATVVTFEKGGDISDLLRGSAKVGAHVGGGTTVAVLPCPNVDAAGMPLPGTVHPNRFAVVTWPGEAPSSADPDVDDDVRTLAAATAWAPRWVALKIEPAPLLESSQLLDGGVRVDTFVAGQQGSAPFLRMRTKLAPSLGHGTHAVIPCAGEIPSTVSTTMFQVISWPGPEITGANGDDPHLALLAARAACSIAQETVNPGVNPPVLGSLERVGQTWAIDVDPDACRGLRSGTAARAAAMLGVESNLVDPTSGTWFIGDTNVDPGIPGLAKRWADVQAEEEWAYVWGQVLLKAKLTPPTLQHGVTDTRVSGRAEVTRYVFAAPLGTSPTDYFGREAELLTALAPTKKAAWVACGAWTSGVRGRAGDRHGQAFCVYVATSKPAPTPETLPNDSGAAWVLTGMVNTAFKGARLPQPELISCKNVLPGVWEVRLRLYGGVTLADVRGARARLETAFGTPWLRVGADPDGCVIYAGARPDFGEQLASGNEDAFMVAALDWEQAMMDAKLVAGGLTATPVSVEPMPENRHVLCWQFTLPSGMDIPTIRKAIPKLAASTGNDFIDVNAGGGGASTMRVLTCPTDPMPSRAPYDHDKASALVASGTSPVATAIDGSTLVWDHRNTPHLLVAGATGGGKSASMQTLLVGEILAGTAVYIIDPSKGAADFKPFSPWIAHIATTVDDGAATIKAVYAEVRRRVDLNSQYGTGSYRDLPDDVRPGAILVVIDEFTSLMQLSGADRKPYDDDELEQQRLTHLADDKARLAIGMTTGRLGREARSAGVFLLIASQEMKADSLNRIPGGEDLKKMLGRLLVGNANSGTMQSSLRQWTEAPPITSFPPGRGWFEPLPTLPVVAQVWYADPAEHVAFLQANVPAFDPARLLNIDAHRPSRAEATLPGVTAVDFDDLLGPDEIDLGEIDFDTDDAAEPVVEIAVEEAPPEVAPAVVDEAPAEVAPAPQSPTWPGFGVFDDFSSFSSTPGR